MGKFPLIGPSYSSQSVNADCQQTMNLYPEVIESGAGNSQIVLYPSPGTKQFVDLAPPGGTAGLQNVRRALSAADLNSSFATPIQLVPAQGPNLVIVPLSAVVQYTFVTTPYTGPGGLNPIIGLGSNQADIATSFVLPIDTQVFKASVNKVESLLALPSWQNLSPAKFVNQPLCWTDNFSPTNGSGDGTAVLNVQFYVLNVVTGKIVNGAPKMVHGSFQNLTTTQIKNANATPIQLVAAPGANQVLMPLTAIVWHHFNTAGLNQVPSPRIGYGSVAAPIITANMFQFFDGNGFLFSADSMEQEGGRFVSNIDPALVVNQPLSWTNVSDIPAATGDTTATVYLQYLVIDTSAGTLIAGTGDLFSTHTEITSAQIKAANVTGVSVAPAPGANLLNVPVYSVAQANFGTTPYSGGNDPNVRISPADTVANSVKLSLTTFFTAGGPFTFWESMSNQMILEPAVFYTPPNNNPGSNILPAVVINEPVLWANFGNAGAFPGDASASLNSQYFIVNTVDGSLRAN
jgi:hypothetical protein